MKRLAIALLLCLTLISLKSALAEGTGETKHLFLPLLGGQDLKGEQVGLSYFSSIYALTLDSTFESNGEVYSDWSDNVPMFGIIYRYIVNQKVFTDVTLSQLQNQNTFVYEIETEYFGFDVSYPSSISHGKTTLLNVDVGYNLRPHTKWLGFSLRGGVGFAWRSVKYRPPDLPGLDVEVQTDILDAENMYITRIGADFTLWKGDQLVTNGSIFITRFIPFGRDVDMFFPGGRDSDSFGGIGWRLSFFPIWLE